MSVIVDFPTRYYYTRLILKRLGFFSFASQNSRFCAAERITLFLDISEFLNFFRTLIRKNYLHLGKIDYPCLMQFIA
jgi:hypothetical protein